MNKERLELLSPAGNIEIFKKVVDAGADAVYFGGELFGARAFAKNFSMEEGAEAIAYAHLYRRKAYLTVNTLLKNLEIEKKLYDYLKAYYEAGLDAIIVQDMGVLEFSKHYFPELEIHASTQMTIANAKGAKWMKEAGASRIVTARELSLAEIAEIHKNVDVEIETFVHGALCVSYSGQCLMSSMLGGRSGNRGRCAQPCRLPYHLYDENGKAQRMPGEYLLSPKDLCGIDDIASLAEAGVYSFKIEGRMKQIAYATGVVSLYRKYVDAYLEGKKFDVSQEDRQMIFDLGNRCGFTNAYFTRRNGKDMITFQKPSHEKMETPFVDTKSPKISVQGHMVARIGQPMELSISTGEEASVLLTGEVLEEASKQATSISQIEEKLKKTGNTPFVFDSISYDVNDGVFVPVGQLNELRRNALKELELKLCGNNSAKKVLPYVKDSLQPTFALHQSNERVFVHCENKTHFLVSCKKDFVTDISASFALAMESFEEICQLAKENHKALYISLPLICRQRAMKLLQEHKYIFDLDMIAGVVASSYDGLGFLEEIEFPKENVILDHRVYTFSNISQFALQKRGYEKFCAPLELNEKELSHRDNKASLMQVYGRIPLMITVNCQHNNSVGCDRKTTLHYLEDRYKERFPVRNVCAYCYNEIYNSKIYSALSEFARIKQMGFMGYRLDFTLESKKQTEAVLAQFEACYIKSEYDKIRQEQSDIFTKGHLKRGVE